jgi:Sigma-70, region 4
MAGYLIPLDPAELASRFSARDEPTFEEEEAEDTAAALSPLSSGNFESVIQPLLHRIPEREADLIQLYYIQKKKQADIAVIFGVTQAAISYRLDRGLKRIRFLLAIPTLEEEDFRRDLPDVPFKPIDVDILVGMWQTTCQSVVAASLGLTQGRVRHRFFGAVKTLEKRSKEDERFIPYFTIFTKISNNFNILHEVCLPQWQDRGGDICILITRPTPDYT